MQSGVQNLPGTGATEHIVCLSPTTNSRAIRPEHLPFERCGRTMRAQGHDIEMMDVPANAAFGFVLESCLRKELHGFGLRQQNLDRTVQPNRRAGVNVQSAKRLHLLVKCLSVALKKTIQLGSQISGRRRHDAHLRADPKRLDDHKIARATIEKPREELCQTSLSCVAQRAAGIGLRS